MEKLSEIVKKNSNKIIFFFFSILGVGNKNSVSSENTIGRSELVKKNIFSTLIIRIISLPISFIIVPLTINYVNAASYGIWLTISSIIIWMSFFDIGINNGLRNKLTESLAVGDLKLSKKYVSTTYAVLILISIAILIVFLIINRFLDWSLILNSPPELAGELKTVSVIVVVYFCLKFVLSTTNIVLLSHQLPAKAAFWGLIEQMSSLIVIFVLIQFTKGALLNLALGLCIMPVLVLMVYNLYMFYGKYKHLAPALSYVDFSLTKDLMGIGFKFFIIQLAGIIQFQTANFIIIQLYGPVEVSVYNIAFKYFSVLNLLIWIFMTPLWSAVTDAYTKNDNDWIVRAEKKYRKIALSIVMLGVVMLLFSNFAFDVWLGKGKIEIPFLTSFLMFLFFSISVFGTIYVNILNGISALNTQFIASIFSPFVFLLLSYCLTHFVNLGLNGIIISSIIANFNAYLVAPLQFKKIFFPTNSKKLSSNNV